MKIAKPGLFLLTVLAALIGHTQTADEIIAKHIDAIGGTDKLKTINAVRYDNTMEIMGNEAPSITTILNGKGMRAETDFNGQKIIQVYSDKGAWMVNPMTGSSDPQVIPGEAAKTGMAQISIVPFLDYAANGAKAEYLGQEKVGDVNAYKIKFTDKNNAVITYFFDPTTYYIVQTIASSEMMGQSIEITSTFSDYKKLDFGWVVPHAVETNMGQFIMKTRLNKAEVNPEVDTNIFDMPAN